MMTGLGPTWCQVDDMTRSIAFYRDGLELMLTSDNPWWTTFDVFGMTLALHGRLEAGTEPLGQNGKGWYLGLQTDDLRTVRQRATDFGGTDHGLHEVPGGVVLTVTDPDGNPIQIVQYGVTLDQVA